MLRASSDATGSAYQLDAIAKGAEAGDGNIPHGSLLVEFVDAVQARDESAMVPLRARIVEAMGEEALVDTCGVIGNFQRMVRVADGTGIRVDDMMLSLSSDFRTDLGVEEFTGAAHSRTSAPRSFAQRVMRPFLRRLLLRAAPRSSD